MVPIFLKNIDKITLEVRSKGDAECRTVFTVQVAQECLNMVRDKRQAFVKSINEKSSAPDQNHLSACYDLTIATRNDRTDVEKVHHYLVRESFASGRVSHEFQKIREKVQKHYQPLVGVAMELRKTSANYEDDDPDGQVFCVLPLPVEQKSSSGLPVHVNGYFSVGQNRRHLKWATAGQNFESDPDIAWNQCPSTGNRSRVLFQTDLICCRADGKWQSQAYSCWCLCCYSQHWSGWWEMEADIAWVLLYYSAGAYPSHWSFRWKVDFS